MEIPPKYSRVEYERRFLLDPESEWRRGIKSYSKLIHDRYLADSRLRLRRMVDSDSGAEKFKLTKKYESGSIFAQPIVSIWLSQIEYNTLLSLPGHDLIKTRHYDEYEGVVFSVDVFSGNLSGLFLCECESDSVESLQAIRFPFYAKQEVTEDEFFTGGSLCRTGWPEVKARLSKVFAGRLF